MLPLLTKEDFCKKVENLVIDKKSSYLEAVLQLQEQYGMDYSLVAKFLSQPLKEKLESEGRDLNLIKKGKSVLPFA
jgi:predicted glycosyltransferase